MKQHTLLPGKPERLRYFGSVSPMKGEKPVEKEKMKDLQNIRKDYFFDIQQVGVANVSHPVTITSAMMPAEQTTAANFTMTCDLQRHQKGINMSRIDVNVKEQKAYIKEGSNTIYTMIVSSGLDQTKDDATPKGTFYVEPERGE